jgi:hypothetical protein
MIAIMQDLAAAASALPSDSSALEASISALKSCISALDNSINTLEGSSAPWEHLAIASSVAVFFGIVGEVVVIVSEYRDDLHDWRRGAVSWVWRIVWPPDRPPRWRFWFDIVATVVVLLGVLGEAWGSFELATINSQLRSNTSELRAKSDQLLALVTQEAGSAVRSAQNAKDLADAEATELKVLNPRLLTIGMEASGFIKAMAPYNGQDVNVKICGDDQRRDEIMEEQRDTQQLVAYVLEDKAGWTGKFDRMLTHESDWKACNSVFGILVWVGPDAPPRTINAAKALAAELTRILPKQEYPVFSVEKPYSADLTSGWSLLDRDPRIVVVVIGERPIPLPRNLARARTPQPSAPKSP